MKKERLSIEEANKYIGRKFIGFAFCEDASKGVHFSCNSDMLTLVGQELEITEYLNYHYGFQIQDERNRWVYPAEFVLENLVEEKLVEEKEVDINELSISVLKTISSIIR